MKIPSLGTLSAAAIGGAAFLGLSGWGFRFLIKKTVRVSPHYNQAMDYLNAHEESKKLLGEPIKQQGSMHIGDKKYFGVYKQSKYYTVPVKGSIAEGNLTYWITINEDKKKDNNSAVEINKILLEVLTKPKKIVWIKNDNKV
ncbi:uncharacterized protein LOC103569381 [Microplitis demolitor]|uniref:uncharacterized protein LOC103569381 n=1 Tax=Microplitis demolitor TaxID=69319 RepID=UPI0006D4E03B|nr:uncharacterized protein LOC103569381 [Microplitis demolitor]